MYRLIVTYPEKPILPEEDSYQRARYETTGFFSWPKNRDYLSLNGAEHRASLFRMYGATVEIVKSRPVVWESQPVRFEGQAWLFEYDDPHTAANPQVMCAPFDGELAPF